jgi:hypothetical protein
MKRKRIGLILIGLLIFAGCSSAMHFVELGGSGSEWQFKQACETCKVVVTAKHSESHGPYRRDTPSGNGVAVDHAANSMTGAIIGGIRAMSGHTWKDKENFQECMKKYNWYYIKDKGAGSLSVKLKGSWKNIVLEYPSSK